jgi:hypothetical protein
LVGDLKGHQRHPFSELQVLPVPLSIGFPVVLIQWRMTHQ